MPLLLLSTNKASLSEALILGALGPRGLILEAIPPVAVKEKSSIASPSFAPLVSISVKRIQNLAPLGMDNALMVALSAVRLAARLPSRAPTAAVILGVMK